jgi:hypothetical protein
MMQLESDPLRVPYLLFQGRYSPVVRVQIFHDSAHTFDLAYIDSGAAYSIFKPRVANELRIDWHAGRRAVVAGLEGRPLPIFLHAVGLQIGDFHLRAEIGFSDRLGLGFNILGRYSIFDQLQFCFNDRDYELMVSRL